MKLLFSFLLCAVLMGCKTPEDTAFKVTGVTVITAQAAYSAYLDWALAAKAPDEQQAKVQKAYDAFYAAVMIEKKAIIAYKDGSNTNGLAVAIAAVTASSSDLIA